MIPKLDPCNAHEVLKDGGIIIYPTEGIYGIGCDALNSDSVDRVFDIKGRSTKKGFIVICSDVRYLANIVDNNYMDCQELLDKDFTTWIIPAHEKCPSWLVTHNTVAVRVTNHPVIHNLCVGLKGPIISTSANYSNQIYVNDIKKIEILFDNKVDCIVNGKLGGEIKPSTIRDIVTKEVLRD
tara:strand:- start:371 stop:916 length:546 start_codon:yes stop_codon:yes gene_type:complete